MRSPRLPLDSKENLALAQDAFARFHTQCFWFLREDLRVTAEHLPTIIKGLRSHGGREAFILADLLAH